MVLLDNFQKKIPIRSSWGNPNEKSRRISTRKPQGNTCKKSKTFSSRSSKSSCWYPKPKFWKELLQKKIKMNSFCHPWKNSCINSWTNTRKIPWNNTRKNTLDEILEKKTFGEIPRSNWWRRASEKKPSEDLLDKFQKEQKSNFRRNFKRIFWTLNPELTSSKVFRIL